MSNFSTTVNISPKDVAILKEQGYSLYGFKAVQAAGSGGAPTVWFSLEKQKLLTETVIHWTEDYQGYNSTSQISENVTINASNTVKADLEQLITIENGSGNLTVSTDGIEGAISFLNKDTQQFTVGINQMVEGKSSTLCAFPILGAGSARVITPIVKIALIFSTAQISTATVITRAMSAGAFIDLTGTNSRTVNYDISTGWSADGATWIQNFNAFTNLSNLLIESPSNSPDRLLSKISKEELECV
jgi:hypothetical protein